MSIKLTPIEKIIINAQQNRARMTLCESVQNLILVLTEIENMKRLPRDSVPYDPSVVAAALKEEKEIVKTLCNIADLWEIQDGVSA